MVRVAICKLNIFNDGPLVHGLLKLESWAGIWKSPKWLEEGGGGGGGWYPLKADFGDWNGLGGWGGAGGRMYGPEGGGNDGGEGGEILLLLCVGSFLSLNLSKRFFNLKVLSWSIWCPL